MNLLLCCDRARGTALRRFVLFALVILALGRPAHAQGFLMSVPPNLVTPNSGMRNNVFYVGQPITFTLQGTAAVRYEVRDYWGNLVDQGPASASITVNASLPGWYKLNLYGTVSQSPWGYSVGGTTFVIYRNDPHFPVVQDPLVSGASPLDSSQAEDEVMRGVTALGPQRHSVQDATNPSQAISVISGSIAIDQQYYLGFNDPIRLRDLLIAFPNGATNQASVSQIVSQFQGNVRYWEPRNEPNFVTSGANFATGEMKSFYQSVKGVNPNMRVLGPGVVSLNPWMLSWMDDFFQAGGGNSIDGFSFHAYNTVNGDLSLARTSLNALNTLLAKYGQDKKEKWQTEQGYAAALYGEYAPRHQGRWEMLQMMVFEQYGIPKEHNNLWYDVSHGFYDEPMFTENGDGSLNPTAPLMRVWSEELYGTQFSQAYNLGATGNKLYLGSLFQGPSKSVAAFMSAGSTDGQITLQVQGGSSIHVVSAFGVASDLPVVGGQVILPVPEMPVYVELAAGQSITPVPIDWGPNLAQLLGVTVQASGLSTHPIDPTINNDINKIHNGVLENWYYTQNKDDHPWMSNVSQFPATVEMDLSARMTVGKVIIYCPVPWQWEGSLLDYELQYDNNGQWVTIDHYTEDPKTYINYSASPACTVDSYYSDRCIFTHQFAPVTTGKLRLLVHDCTWGGGATQAVVNAGGQTGPHQFSIREIEVYPPTPTGPQIPPVVSLSAPTAGAAYGMPAVIPVTATVTAGSNPIVRMDFFANGIPIGFAMTSPYTVNWQPTVASTYTLTAIATDSGGLTATSTPVLVTVTPPANLPGQVRFFPRPTVAARMVGGCFQGSNDGVTYTNLYTVTAAPPDGQWSAAPLTVDPATFRYLRYLSPPGSYGNVSEVEFDTGSGTAAVKLTGTGFGSPGSYLNGGATFAKALDGDATTFFDAPTSDGNFVGIDRGGTIPVTPTPALPGQVRFFPRPTVAARMVGGRFQGSNDGTTYSDLCMIAGTPPDGQWSAAPLTVDPATFRYLRYLSPPGSYGNVSEVEFDTGSGTAAVKLTGTGFGSPGSYLNGGATFAKALDGDATTFFDAPTSDGNFVGISRGATTPVTTSNMPPTVSITAPTSGATATVGTPVSVTAAAADSDGTVAQVALYAGTTLVATDTTAPYTFTWTPTSASGANLSAVATDNQGATTTSSVVNITVTPPANLPGQVRFFPRPTVAARMVGGCFQGSNDGVTYTNLYTVTAAPPDGQWSAAPLTVDPATFRYLRYLSPPGSYGNVSEVEFDTGSGTAAVKLTGTGFGSPGSYLNGGATFAKALDGDATTFFDAPTSDGNFVGISRGGPAPVTVPPGSAGQVRFFPRPTVAARMVGGCFQGSNDGVTYTNLYTVTAAPPDGQWSAAPLTVDPATFRYLRYLSPPGSYGNVSEVEFDTGSGTAAVKLTGTGFGSPGSYLNGGATFAKALDGDATTFFDAPTSDGNFVGISRGGPAPVTVPPGSAGQVRFFPRPTVAARMVGGCFQGSNDGVTYTNLYTVTAAPPDGQWSAAPLTVDPATFRYLRYLSPPGSYGNVSEVEFDTGSGTAAVKLTGTGFGSPGSYLNGGATFAKALDGDATTFFDAPTPDGNFVGIATR